MKKLFILMFSGLAVFTSCSLDKGENGNDAASRRKMIASSMHNSNIGQVQVNLDPFNIAFRLNTLMVESEAYGGDVNHSALGQMREELFGAQSAITADQGVYTISLQGQGKYDYLHSGKVVVNTGGATLSNGNSWSLNIPESANYRFSMGGTTVGLIVDGYYITANEDNKWAIQIVKLVSNRPDTEYAESKSDWSGKITIKQDQFADQKLESVAKSTYSMEIESDYQIKTMYATDTMMVQTTTPLVFNPECAQGQIVGSGTMKTTFTSPWADPVSMFTMSEWKGEGVKCDPQIEVTYYGAVQE